MNQLSPNKQFDRLISTIQVEKDKASKSYFENLLNGGNQQSNNSSNRESIPVQELTPIQQLFHNHMKRSLHSYEEYYQKLKAKYDASEEQIKQKFANMMLEFQNSQKGKPLAITQNTQIAQWKTECDAQIAEVSKAFQRCIEMLLHSYDEYMKGYAPPPQFLPIILTIQVPSKSVQFPKVHINPTDTAVEVRQIISQKMEKKGDCVVQFDPSNVLKLVNGTDSSEEGVLITDDNIPIIQFHPDPGALLILQGQLQCKSDAPQECFKQSFVKGANMKMDYFTCKDCKLNWVCKYCANTCHSGHKISEYIHDHTPTWACCYCGKIGKCNLAPKEIK